MLPKVANHLSRAVVSLQSQTGHTIRNVLQSSGSTTAVTGWGTGSSSHGPGPSKFHTSSRFHLQTPPSSVSQQAREVNEKLKPLRNVLVQKRAQHLAAESPASELSAVVRSGLGTYANLISSLTDRDYENHQQLLQLERRRRRHRLAALEDDREDATKIASLRDDQHFLSAFALFSKAAAGAGFKPPLRVYNKLLRSCVIHSNADAATTVFAHLESRGDLVPSAQSYIFLIATHASRSDLAASEAAFDSFKRASFADRVHWSLDEVPGGAIASQEHAAQLAVWNEMLDAYFRCGQPAQALGLLETMMDSAPSGPFTSGGIPSPSSQTYAGMIRGFCRSGNVTTALNWFEQLLQQTTASGNPHESSAVPHKPDESSWGTMLEALADAGKIAELYRVFARLLEIAREDGIPMRRDHRDTVLAANLSFLDAHPEMEQDQANSLLNFLSSHGLPTRQDARGTFVHRLTTRALASRLISHYWIRDLKDRALEVFEDVMQRQLNSIHAYEASEGHISELVAGRMQGLQDLMATVTARLLAVSPIAVGLPHLLRLVALSQALGIPPPDKLQQAAIDRYALLRAGSTTMDITASQWETLLALVFVAEPQFPGTLNAVVDDLLRCSVNIIQFSDSVQQTLASTLVWTDPNSAQLLAQLGEPYKSRFEQLQKPTALSTTPETLQPEPLLRTGTPTPPPSHRSPSPVRIAKFASRFVGEFFPSSKISPLTAYERLITGVNKGAYPRPLVLARLISALGRLGEFDKVHEVYAYAQHALGALEDSKQQQSTGWFLVEDNMIGGLAHAGDVEAAHTHRARIVENGGVPSADAYAALILHVKDTTDDTSNAMALFNEAVGLGVVPNLFMYNTVISKLAKARKADHALELFQEMKGRGVHPTSVTYGAVIAACCRVGDATSAETLFEEMTAEPTFKPRVPPYNTMMQLYTHTKPDRARVLEYYHALKAADVRPTAHTYKLLLDAHGCIEPVDAQGMYDVFKQLVADRSVTVQGTHWAALINAVGCVQKDLEQALSIFDSITTYPTKPHEPALPDAVVYESLFNTLVTLKRVDLLPTYLQKLKASGIHMTAYIANLLIKGYASVGDIDRAREIFEALQDPEDGAAAPFNHTPHQNKQTAPVEPIPADAPIYREPSTWETMVRAELGSGHRERAVALLQRLQARMFPPAVYQRISGIMLDDSVAPWALSDSSSSPIAA